MDSAGNLYVADRSNNRVLFYLAGSTTATRVYGQGGNFNFVAFTPITADSLSGPTGIALDSSGNVYIADSGNSRILFYAGASTTATRVYGQFGSFTSGDFGNPGGVSANTLSRPSQVVAVTGTIYIADTNNFRVLGYSGTSTTAQVVYGQPSLTTAVENNGGITASSMSNPYDMTMLANFDIYVADSVNNRVLKYLGPLPTEQPPATTAPASGSNNVCFHFSTVINYNGKRWALKDFQTGIEPECVIPHLVKATGVELEIVCPHFYLDLTLTPDHLVFTDLGYVAAGKLTFSHQLFYRADGGDLQKCSLQKKTLRTEEEVYFGLNCLESQVAANGVLVSTFGHLHQLPAMWMRTVGSIFGIKAASSWGDLLASVWA